MQPAGAPHPEQLSCPRRRRTTGVREGVLSRYRLAALDISHLSVTLRGQVKNLSQGQTLTLSGANTYTGATAVNAGVLNVRHATGLGGIAAGTTVSSGARCRK